MRIENSDTLIDFKESLCISILSYDNICIKIIWNWGLNSESLQNILRESKSSSPIYTQYNLKISDLFYKSFNNPTQSKQLQHSRENLDGKYRNTLENADK